MNGRLTFRQARSTHGLSSRDDSLNWRTRGLCVDQNPNWWNTGDGTLSAHNGSALALCARCPVRTHCRDDMLTIEPAPRSIIAGGWRWNSGGEATPFGDDPLPAGVQTASISKGRSTIAPLSTRLAAAHRYMAGTPLKVVAAETGLSRHAVYDLARILREGDEGLIKAVTGGLPVRTAMRTLRHGRVA